MNHMKIGARVLAMVAAAGAATTVAASAEARWRAAAPCLKAIAERTRSSGDVHAWALSCEPGAGGNFKIVYSRRVDGPTTFFWQWPLDPQGGQGMSITVRDGIPWVISADNRVWWKAPPASGGTHTGGTWHFYPTNACEGGNVTLRMAVGDTTIAVGNNNIVYVVDGEQQVRTWNGSCWAQLPRFSFRRVIEIAIWGGQPAQQAFRPWVVLDNGTLWRYTDSNVWQFVANGVGFALATSHMAGSGNQDTRWTYNFTTNSFAQDLNWTQGVIKQLTDAWVVTPGGTTYHWE